jgi:hypothetical protein
MNWKRSIQAACLTIAAILICESLALPLWPQNPSEFETEIRPFLSQNCFGCHNSSLKSGNLNLEQYTTNASIDADRERWMTVLHKLRSGEMPPKGMPRPNEAASKSVVSWLEASLGSKAESSVIDPGSVTARRLNRTEYNNTTRDLLGVDLQLADSFPQDDSGYGFDNIGDVLSLSPVLMEQYLGAAEKLARTAVFGHELLKPTVVKLRANRRLVPTTVPSFDYDVTGLSLPNAIHVTHRFPVDGEYVIRLFLDGVRPAGSEPVRIALWLDGKQTNVVEVDPATSASFSVHKQDFGGGSREFRVKLSGGEHWIAASILNLFEGLPGSYAGPNPSRLPIPPPRPFRAPPNAPPQRVAELRKQFEADMAEKVPANDARVSSVEIGGPYHQTKGPSLASLRSIYACGHMNGVHRSSCGREIVSSLAHRAFRRPVSSQEVDRFVGLVTAARKNGDAFEEGIAVALQAMLVSPHFLFRIENQPARPTNDAPYNVSDHELASRLSYFLWSSMPDDRLMALADKKRLREKGVLEAEVKRMLDDPKSQALVKNFGGQWLELRKLESIRPDRERFPAFEDYLRMSMRQETESFFEYIVREDRSILEFIDGEYSFLNERLARHYGISGVKGPEFQKVQLSAETQRGGLLTQSSILTVSSYPTRTSPVLRGKWILENILNSPPPPPPPDVPNLDEAAVTSASSLREQLEQHRKNPTCASCHARMDPLGFGLENFDAVGAWRSQIDSSGSLPDGRSFKGPVELRAILKADKDAFAEGLTEKLLTFALGRGVESYDKPAVKQIAGALAANDYRFSILVLGIVKSLPFQMRRGRQR